MFSASTMLSSCSGMANGCLPCVASDADSVDCLNDAACFLACSSASFKDSAKAALRSASSSSSSLPSSSFLTPLARTGDHVFFNCDCGTKPIPAAPALLSSRLISSARRKSSSKRLAWTRAFRGCMPFTLGANETFLSPPSGGGGLPPLVSFA